MGLLDKNLKIMFSMLKDLLEKLNNFYGFMEILGEIIFFEDLIKVFGNINKYF